MLNDDPVLSALQETEAAYRSTLEAINHKQEGQQQQIAGLKAHLQQVRAEAVTQKARADQMASALKDIHRAFYSGNLYDLILRACLTLTGATRGLYISAESTTEDSSESRRVRAAIDVDDYPSSPPSSFLKRIAEQVSRQGESLVFSSQDHAEDHAEDRGDGLPDPAGTAEGFQNYMAAPVMFLRGLRGVLIAADKAEGEFSADDVQTLLHIGDQASIALENHTLREDLQKAYLATVSVLASAMEAKDPYTLGHCKMVARYAVQIGQQLDLESQELSVIGYTALLHDIGKIGISDGILNKPGPLLPEERELVRSHVRVGKDLLHHIPALAEVAESVFHHHEWYDGTGYPDCLRAEEIPLASRIVGVVDAYAAMISRRSYKEAYGTEYAQTELRRCAGSQFDPAVVVAFLTVLEKDSLKDEDLSLPIDVFWRT